MLGDTAKLTATYQESLELFKQVTAKVDASVTLHNFMTLILATAENYTDQSLERGQFYRLSAADGSEQYRMWSNTGLQTHPIDITVTRDAISRITQLQYDRTLPATDEDSPAPASVRVNIYKTSEIYGMACERIEAVGAAGATRDHLTDYVQHHTDALLAYPILKPFNNLNQAIAFFNHAVIALTDKDGMVQRLLAEDPDSPYIAHALRDYPTRLAETVSSASATIQHMDAETKVPLEKKLLDLTKTIDFSLLEPAQLLEFFSSPLPPEILNSLKDRKEQVLTAILAHPSPDDVKALLNAATPEHPLHTLFNLQRGIIHRTETNTAKKAREELVKRLPAFLTEVTTQYTALIERTAGLDMSAGSELQKFLEKLGAKFEAASSSIEKLVATDAAWCKPQTLDDKLAAFVGILTTIEASIKGFDSDKAKIEKLLGASTREVAAISPVTVDSTAASGGSGSRRASTPSLEDADTINSPSPRDHAGSDSASSTSAGVSSNGDHQPVQGVLWPAHQIGSDGHVSHASLVPI